MTTLNAQEALGFIKDEFPLTPDPEVIGSLTVSDVVAKVNVWLERGDGIAVYENLDLGHPQIGEKRFVSFGSDQSQLEGDVPPTKLPDIGNSINWRFKLVGHYRGETL